MTSKFSIDNRELLQRISSGEAVVGIDFGNLIVRELAAFRLVAMGSEPVAWTDEQELRDVDRGGCGYLFTVNPVTPHADERRIILLYRHAQPAPVVPEVDADDNFYSWFGREWAENYQHTNTPQRLSKCWV